jgi:chemotaxis protein methyltransferase CheR
MSVTKTEGTAISNRGPATIDRRTFRKIADMVYALCGIKLTDRKEALVQARISKRMRKLGIASFRDYITYLENDETGVEITAMLDAISTNVTHFFREPHHFELLAQLLTQWAEKGQTRFRIWSAACSTGEEPYTIAITIHETLQDLRDVKILATDLSTEVVARARIGVYPPKTLDKAPQAIVRRYFRKIHDDAHETMYRIDDQLKRMITFGRINLSKPPFPLHGPLDIIFCRNVMIYFDNRIRATLLADMYRLLKPGGYLMVGHAESLSGMLSDFKSVIPSVYIK